MDLAPWEKEELEQWKGGQAKEPEVEEARPTELSGETLRTHVSRSPTPSATTPDYEPPRPTLPPQPLRTQTDKHKPRTQELSPGLQKVRDNALSIVMLVALTAFSFVFYTNCSVFIVTPTDTDPKGATLITSRLSGLNFIDSAEGFLTRHQGTVTPSSRSAMVDNITGSAKVYVELPYFERLHRYTTGGK